MNTLASVMTLYPYELDYGLFYGVLLNQVDGRINQVSN